MYLVCTHMYPYVLVWCFSHDHFRILQLAFFPSLLSTCRSRLLFVSLRERCKFGVDRRITIPMEINLFHSVLPQACNGILQCMHQPRSQGLRGKTVTKTLVKFVLSFQNFGKKIACAVRHNRIQLYCNTVVSHCACDFFPKILER